MRPDHNHLLQADLCNVRVTFPSTTNVAAIGRAYRDLPYIKSVESAPPVLLGHRIANGMRGIRALGGGQHAVVRIPTKVVFGALLGATVTAIGTVVSLSRDNRPHGSDAIGAEAHFFVGLLGGCAIGFPLGVTTVDLYDSSLGTLVVPVVSVGTGFLLAYQKYEEAAVMFDSLVTTPFSRQRFFLETLVLPT